MPMLEAAGQIRRNDDAHARIPAVDARIDLRDALRHVVDVKILTGRKARQQVPAFLGHGLVKHHRGLMADIRMDGEAKDQQLENRQQEHDDKRD